MADTGSGLDRIGIVVAGMHRSGTSLLADCLARLGVSLPAELIPADGNNPRGYFEFPGLNRLFDRILATAGRTWDDWRALPRDWQSLPDTAAAWASVQGELREAFGQSRTFVLKDPRVCRFVGEIGSELHAFGAEMRVVMPIRHPMEVARSLSARDGFSLPKGGILWLRHVLDAEKASRTYRRTFVTYDELVSDWHATAGRIEARLGTTFSRRDSEPRSSPVDHALRHHRQAELDGFGETALARWTADVHAGLLRLVNHPSDPAVLSMLDGVREELDDCCSIFGSVLDESAAAIGVERRQQDRRIAEIRTAVEREHAAIRLEEASERLVLQRKVHNQDKRIDALKRNAAKRERLLMRQAEKLDRTQLELRVVTHHAQAWRGKAGTSRPAPLWERALTAVGEATVRKRSARRRRREEKWARSKELVQASGLFDAGWYRARYADVDRSGIDPLDHFVRHGDREGRDPGPLFDSAWYREHYPDLGKYVPTLLHFLRHGLIEGRDRLPLSSRLQVLPSDDLAAADTYRARKQVVAPFFDAGFYLRTYPELAAEKIEPIDHFVRWGWHEGRYLNETLDLNGLYDLHPELRAAFEKEEAQRFDSGASDYAGHYFAARLVAESPRSDADYEPPGSASVSSSACDVKAIAFYLPQFHPIAENDAAWGAGFTEWTNVSKAVPEFLGHYQPHLPGELGFYDLRVPTVMALQAALAKQHGIHGFCFHHYWFAGKRVLEKPVQQFLADRSIDIPFCLSWANENWSRRWDGSEHDIIIAQSHSAEDDLAFIADLIPAFRDPRYITIEGKPVLVVYRPVLLPNARETAERWRSYCRAQGLGEIFLVYAQTFHFTEPPAAIGFDAAVEFPPHSLSVPNIAPDLKILNPRFRGLVADYRELVRRAHEAPASDYLRFPTVFPSWDNSPRRPARGTIFAYAAPAHYRDWLDASFRRARRDLPPGHRFVFINAWNEWGEGAHLEPDRRYGYAWLNATAAVVRDHSESGIPAGARRRSRLAAD